jgi:hypothetical protein
LVDVRAGSNLDILVAAHRADFLAHALFVSFGLFATMNATVITSYLIAAISVSAAIFLIVEMYSPYSGLIHVSSAPLRAAIAHLGNQNNR